MKRYLLFAGETYYPGGGARDFVRSSDDLEDLKKVEDEARVLVGEYNMFWDWCEIFDTETEQIVWHVGRDKD